MTAFEETVTAAEVSSYLASKGWQREGVVRGATIWRPGSGPGLLVPDLYQLEDAAELIVDAIKQIAELECRPEAEVRRDIAEPTVDAQYFRTHPDAPSGSIPLPAGARAVQGVHHLIKSAASTVEQGTQAIYDWRQRRGSRVEPFLRRVLLGVGPPGSFVLTARIPAEAFGMEQLALMADSAEFSGRMVVKQMHTALQAAHDAATRVVRDSRQVDVFYEAVPLGVSANLCRALSDLGGDRKDRPFEVGFSWARAIPAEIPGEGAEVAFTAGMPAVLAKAADELEALASEGAAQITGTVVRLEQEYGERPRIQIRGDLTLPGGRRRVWRSIWVVVDAVDYDKAFAAQRVEQSVEVSGDLSKRPRLELVARNFRVING